MKQSSLSGIVSWNRYQSRKKS